MQNSDVLDNRDAMDAIDGQRMSDIIHDFPKQWRVAAEIAYNTSLQGISRPDNVVIVGMGGSAIGGDLIKAVLENVSDVPIAVQRDYTLPAYVNEKTLVVASSYSGDTEETLSACSVALERKAQLAAVTTGGKLGQIAREHGFPVVTIPGGLSPRAALGYSFVPLLVLMEAAGLTGDIDVKQSIRETADILESIRSKMGEDVPSADNPAKQLAAQLEDRVPLIYGTGGWRATAAYRWKCQFNENSQTFAIHNTYPELNHNETVGLEYPEQLIKNFHLITLRDSGDAPKVATRADVTTELIQPHIAGVSQFVAQGESTVARLFSLIYPADFVSLYLAFLLGVDPTPIKMIDLLKRKLAEAEL